MASDISNHQQYVQTSGGTDAVWIHKDKYVNRLRFPALASDDEADVCVIGSGISGISVAYELITRGKRVVMIEARGIISGETGRTSGHLSNALDDHYTMIKEKHGFDGAKAAAESHTWALHHVGEIARKLHIDCEYRHVPGYEISQFQRGSKDYKSDIEGIKEEVKLARELGLDVNFDEELVVRGWDGKPDQRGGAVFPGQAAFHPTLYLAGIMKSLKDQSNFACYTNTRMTAVTEKGVEILGLGQKYVEVQTESGHTIRCNYAVEATGIPLQKLSVVAEMEYVRTYCIAIRIPKDSVEDCFIYDSAEPYIYVRLTACDDKDDYIIVGGGDHKVGQEEGTDRFKILESWARKRFTKAGSVDYRWSGQVNEPVDHVAFIGKNQGCDRTYIVTGDSGNGLTHGVIAGRLIADEIDGVSNPWTKLYNPKRVASIAKSALSMAEHDLQINTQYKRVLQTDITDIEDLVPGSGGVLNVGLSKPMAVYKDDDGKVVKLSALCPHMKGVVCWNPTERSFDCPVHGSRFSATGICVNGPAKVNLAPVE